MGFTTVSEDKFTKTKITTWNAWQTKPGLSSQLHAGASLGIIWYLDSLAMAGVEEGIGMGMRLLEKEGVKVISIDYEYHRWEWMHIGNGKLMLLLDGNDLIELQSNETKTHVFTSGQKGGKIYEKGYWTLTEGDFKKICDSSKVEVRVYGSNSFIEFQESHNVNFLFMLRSMYNESIDSTLYIDQIESINKENQEKSESNKKWGKGCLIVIGIFVLFILAKACS